MKFILPQSYIDDGLVRVVTHPTLPLRLYNYTEHCQFDKKWDDITLQCRGLVVDAEDNIVARPFKKFFNYEEHQGTLPDGTPEVIEKVDGSLGIVFYYDDKWHVATRGSFTSEQAQHGQMVLESKYGDASFCLPTNLTHLFEIIYPQNRIVVNYGEKDDLVYLGSVFIETGDHAYCSTAIDHFPQPARLGVQTFDLLGLKSLESSNAEGFVLAWPSGFRLKIKFDEYKRLHKILTNTTERSIWESMKEGKTLAEFIEAVPDEFHTWVQEVEGRLRNEYSKLCRESYDQVQSIRSLHAPQTRKEWAELIQKYAKYPALCFIHLDGKDISDNVWRLIKPAATKPFKVEI
jgi:RNA ligase